MVSEDKTRFSVLPNEQCSSRSRQGSSCTAHGQLCCCCLAQENSNNGKAVTRTKPRKGTRTCSENSFKSTQLWKNTLQLTEWNRKSPNHLPGFIYKEFKVFKGTNSTSVGAKFPLCLAAIILSSSPSGAHFARNEVINSAATFHHTQHKAQHQIYIRNAALDWQEKHFQHSAAIWWQSHSTDGAQVAEAGTFSVFRATLRRDTNPHKPGPAHLGPSQPNSAVRHCREVSTACSTQTAEAERQNSCPQGTDQPGVKHLLLGKESLQSSPVSQIPPGSSSSRGTGEKGVWPVGKALITKLTHQVLSPDTHSCSCSHCPHQWADKQTQKWDRRWY